MEFLLTTDETINWYNHFGKHWVIYTKIEHKHTPWPHNSTTRYISYRNVYMCTKSYIQEYSIRALFIVVQNEKQPRCSSTVKWINHGEYSHTTK